MTNMPDAGRVVGDDGAFYADEVAVNQRRSGFNSSATPYVNDNNLQQQNGKVCVSQGPCKRE